MRIFGLTITREKSALSSVSGRNSWFPIIREPFSGAWQQNVDVRHDKVLTHFAVFACMTLIASDIAKLRLRLVERDNNGIWSETERPAFSPVLRKPNPIQTRIQFWEHWMLSKLATGNTYALKERDNRGLVTRLYVLDPHRVQVLVSTDGDIFYRLSTDNVSGLTEDVIVPAREIIHDRMNCLFHPLVGISPIMAAGLAATQGLNIQQDATNFFGNAAMPGGILTAPGAIADETAARLKASWEENYSGNNRGRTAVLGDGLKFEAMRATAADSQVIEQLKWTADVVCSVFHVPPYKIGIGPMPTYNNIQALNVEYYSQALQMHIESAEAVLDEGLGLGLDGTPDARLGTEFELDGLLRMDSLAQFDVLEKAKGVLTLDERRRKIDYKPVPGGETIYLQQQDHSLEAIAARDSTLIAQAGASHPDVQDEALNGAQITALQGLVVSAALGEIPVDTVRAVITAAFPLLSEAEVSAIVAPIAALVAAGNGTEEGDDDDDGARAGEERDISIDHILAEAVRESRERAVEHASA